MTPPRRRADGARRVRVLHVITRLNMSGASHQVAILNSRLDPSSYDSMLVTGRLGPGEEALADPPEDQRGRVVVVPDLRPEIKPLSDARALASLVRLVRSFEPDIVSTNMAKAGLLGRLAALVARRPRPVVVHTYHGHVLEHYFGRAMNRFVRTAEARLARVSSCLIGVSLAVIDDLVRLEIAPRAKFRHIPAGRDLDPFLSAPPREDSRFRRELDLDESAVLFLYVGRLVPIKRVDLILGAFAAARRERPEISLAVVGDGPLRAELVALADELGVAGAAHFAGYRTDMVDVVAGADVAILASDNEGLPAFLIEAAAAGRPAVATAVGGVGDIVAPETGILVARGDEAALSAAIVDLASNRELRAAMSERARRRAVDRFSAERVVRETQRLFAELQPAPPGSSLAADQPPNPRAAAPS